MPKKIGTSLLLAIAGVGLLTGCSQSNPEMVSMDGVKITQNDFFKEIKKSDSTKSAFKSFVIQKLFEKNYSDKVEQTDIDKKFNEAKETYGDQFANVLKQNGLTEKTYKESIMKNLTIDAGLKSHVKITQAELEKTWKTYHPSVNVQLIQVDDKQKAEDLHKKLTSGADFSDLAKKESTDESTKDKDGKIAFDSTSKAVSEEVKQAAFKLKNNELSPVVKGTSPTTLGEAYYIIRMIEQKEKGNDLTLYKKELVDIIQQKKIKDSKFVASVIKEEMKKEQVKITDPDYQQLISDYLKQLEK